MSSQTKNPPRNDAISLVPLPQTNLGTLEHSGETESPVLNITDIPPDFGWMNGMWKYLLSFTVDTTQLAKTHLQQFLVMLNPGRGQSWDALPFFSSKWWTGVPCFRFTAIMPARVTGKLLIRFHYNMETSATDPDTKYLSIAKEWDLSQSSQFEFEVPGVMPLMQRPTNVYEYPTSVPTALHDNYHKSVMEFGSISVEVSQRIVPGSIFPDSYTIYVERSFRDAVYSTPIDPRHDYTNAIFGNDR